MAKVSEKAREIYNSKIKTYKKTIQDVQLSQKELMLQMRKEELKANYIKLKVSDMTLNIVSYYLLMDSLSQSLLGIKNETFLNEGRKAVYKAIIMLEEIFSDYIDAPYGDYEEGVSSVRNFGELDRFRMIRKIAFTIQTIRMRLGENNRWKWSFVELQARLAVLAKNCVDMKKFVAGMDPHAEGYSQRLHHLRITENMMSQSAQEYRRKYELSTRRMDDFKMAINLLAGLRRLNIFLSNTSKAEELKKQIEVWKHKMNLDLKNQEKERSHRS